MTKAANIFDLFGSFILPAEMKTGGLSKAPDLEGGSVALRTKEKGEKEENMEKCGRVQKTLMKEE